MSAQTAERGHAKLVPVNLHAAAGQAGMRYLIYATTLWMLSLSLAHVIRQTTRADALAEMIRARCAARSLREIDREARFSAVFHWPNYSSYFNLDACFRD
jgi:hypothetical protein